MTPQEAIVLLSQMYLLQFDDEKKEALTTAIFALEKQIAKEPMTQFEKLKQMNTDEAAVFISALADSCKDVARYGNQTIPHLVKILLESEVEEE